MSSYALPAEAEFAKARGPCPGLNALANAGVIPRSGQDIQFFVLFHALRNVYGLSWALALFLLIPTYLVYGRLQVRCDFSAQSSRSYERTTNVGKVSRVLRSAIPAFIPSLVVDCTLDLASLSSFGPRMFAHRASLIHPDCPSHAPTRTMWTDIVSLAADAEKGLTLQDLALLRVLREAQATAGASKTGQETDLPELHGLHEQIALGESGLMWAVFKSASSDLSQDEGIPLDRLHAFLLEERIPDPWYGIGGKTTVGLIEARRAAVDVGRRMKELRSRQ